MTWLWLLPAAWIVRQACLWASGPFDTGDDNEWR